MRPVEQTFTWRQGGGVQLPSGSGRIEHLWLFQLMRVFDAARLLGIATTMAAAGGLRSFSENRRRLLYLSLCECREAHNELGLVASGALTQRLLATLENWGDDSLYELWGGAPPSWERFIEQLGELESRLIDEVQNKVCFSLTTQEAKYFNEPTFGWEKIIDRFPDSQEDIEEMNKCFALSRYTAAVFHSLLVVEHGLIALGHHIGVTDPKPGWDATYRKLNELVNNRSTIPVHLEFNFLEQSKARLDSMKLAWRNKVNHAAGHLIIEKTGFTDVSAEEVVVACRSFMRHLAERLPK